MMRRLCVFLMLVSVSCGYDVAQPRRMSAAPQPRALSQVWVPITLASVRDRAVRSTLEQALRVASPDAVWTGFTIDEHSVVFVFEKPVLASYCVGSCGTRPASRLWRMSSKVLPPAGNIFGDASAWGITSGQDRVVVVRDRYGVDAVAFAVHEDFHLTFQTRYGRNNPSAFEDGEQRAHMLSRRDLETAYSQSEDVSRSIAQECRLLAGALRQFQNRRPDEGRELLRQFLDVRADRRSRPGAPAFEEDYWERLEGIPTNLERRTARLLGEDDPSLVADAVGGTMCAELRTVSYLVVLGALQAALLDDGRVDGWESYVYPTEPRPSMALSELIKVHLATGASTSH